MINAARTPDTEALGQPVVDVHPDRPIYRGFNAGPFVASLEADPSFEELERAGGRLVKEDGPHAVLDGM
jgi:7,8-dihydropterin-6-yl-methyl-4-(beta-D-ribofuranosyl)aminobenzene 5'-phosphate synthase